MIQRVLVGIDFSEASRAALERATALAQQFHVPLTAMHVVERPSLAAYSVYASMGDPAWYQAAEPRVQEHLASWLGASAAEALVRTGSPAEELMAAAEPGTLLVVGQVGHSLLDRMLMGSTASKVVRHAHCDVLVVRGGSAAKA